MIIGPAPSLPARLTTSVSGCPTLAWGLRDLTPVLPYPLYLFVEFTPGVVLCAFVDRGRQVGVKTLPGGKLIGVGYGLRVDDVQLRIGAVGDPYGGGGGQIRLL